MSHADLWYVMLADGDVHRVTLDQLDEAFQAGHIDHETLVLAAGARQWTPLGQLAGLEETPPPPKVPVTNSFRPVSVDLTEVEISEVSFRGSGGTGKKWLAAVGALSVAATLVGVAINRPVWAQPYVNGIQAYVGRVVHVGRSAPDQSAAAAAPPAVTEPPPAAANLAPPSLSPVMAGGIISPPPSDATKNQTPDRFAADMKQKLLEADKQRDAKSKARARTFLPQASHSGAKSKFGGFTTGGNKYDPLNSGI
jgi:hypothetical protein